MLAQAYPKEDWATLPARLKSYANPTEMDDFYLPLGANYKEPAIAPRAVKLRVMERAYRPRSGD